jgi:hypothetical protein
MKVLPAARIYDNVKTFKCEDEVRTEIKEARAQRLHADIVQFCHLDGKHSTHLVSNPVLTEKII